jgi:hypothetical protein
MHATCGGNRYGFASFSFLLASGCSPRTLAAPRLRCSECCLVDLECSPLYPCNLVCCCVAVLHLRKPLAAALPPFLVRSVVMRGPLLRGLRSLLRFLRSLQWPQGRNHCRLPLASQPLHAPRWTMALGPILQVHLIQFRVCLTDTESGPLTVLIDGHNLIYRCFYGVPAMTRNDGVPTNAAFGFTRSLMKLLSAYRSAAHFGTKTMLFRAVDALRSRLLRCYLRQCFANVPSWLVCIVQS